MEFLTPQVTGLGGRSYQLSQVRICLVILFLFQSKPFTICVLFSSFDSDKNSCNFVFLYKESERVKAVCRRVSTTLSQRLGLVVGTGAV